MSSSAVRLDAKTTEGPVGRARVRGVRCEAWRIRWAAYLVFVLCLATVSAFVECVGPTLEPLERLQAAFTAAGDLELRASFAVFVLFGSMAVHETGHGLVMAFLRRRHYIIVLPIGTGCRPATPPAPGRNAKWAQTLELVAGLIFQFACVAAVLCAARLAGTRELEEACYLQFATLPGSFFPGGDGRRIIQLWLS